MGKDVLVDNKKTKKNSKIIWWIVGLSILAVGLLVLSQFLFTENMLNTQTFHDNTKINNIDVSGLTTEEAGNIVATELLSSRDNVVLKLTYKEKSWEFSGSDFEANDSLDQIVTKEFQNGRKGNIFEKRAVLKNIRENGANYQISYRAVLGGIDQKLENVFAEIEREPVEPILTFNPDAKEMFTLTPGQDGVEVNRDEVDRLIDEQFGKSKDISVEIPVIYTAPERDGDLLLANTKKRSEFKTNYKTSTPDRKHNVRKGLEAFNGMVVLPGEEVSFNAVTGARTEANGYKKANVILNGVFIEGNGGGVCQSSTTLYNALILSDLEILEANHHSLPVAYVPLAFDAMVSEGYSDLKFKNTTSFPIYFKTYGNDEFCNVEIYGEPFEEGVTLRRKTEFIGVIPHNGDRIIRDEEGKYADKITFRGEYFRVKFPREGYESKGYIEYLQNGEVVASKLLRHDYYQPQEGIIYEGTEDVYEGVQLPPNEVEFIGPQSKPKTNKENVEQKISGSNPSEYNP